jgi:hypothetical protein
MANAESSGNAARGQSFLEWVGGLTVLLIVAAAAVGLFQLMKQAEERRNEQALEMARRNAERLNNRNAPPAKDPQLEWLDHMQQERNKQEFWIQGAKALQEDTRLRQEQEQMKALMEEANKQIGRLHHCQRLLKTALTPREELLNMPVTEVRMKADSLEQQLRVAGQWVEP